MFGWVTLPKGINTAELLEVAIAQEQVAFIPGHAFAAVDCDVRHCLRLNFSSCSLERIEEGIQRLAWVLKTKVPGT
jgi:DNA-binding transcriptional MocR family regulator